MMIENNQVKHCLYCGLVINSESKAQKYCNADHRERAHRIKRPYSGIVWVLDMLSWEWSKTIRGD